MINAARVGTKTCPPYSTKKVWYDNFEDFNTITAAVYNLGNRITVKFRPSIHVLTNKSDFSVYHFCYVWTCITPLLDYPPKKRGVIYTTSAIESVNMNLAKKSMNRGLFLSDEALLELI